QKYGAAAILQLHRCFFIKDAGGGHGSPAVHSGNRHTRGSMAGIDPYIVGADSISARKPCGCGNVRG
uniref:hypothetical protein n=1 Tax=Gemmiger formicilis TaxID=745368 RepID=UPI004024C474